jgi:hypothetical protein
MERRVTIVNLPENLSTEWDKIADFYFQKKEFLIHLHKYNHCSQRYYELFENEKLVAGAVVYTLKVDILTFTNIPSPVTMHIIGLPASIAAPPVIGNQEEFQYLLNEILRKEKGLILGLNFLEDYLVGKVINMRTLPTVILKKGFDSIEDYENSMRHSYRRRLKRFREKFSDVRTETSGCSDFTREHYRLYMEIMKRTRTKLEILNAELFRNLPSNFELTTHYNESNMLCWYITCKDDNVLFFFFGGMDYSLRDKYQSYHNNLYSIIAEGVRNKYKIIDLGQTAEIAKSRLGGRPEERRMFLYHRNQVIFHILRLFRSILTYSGIAEKSNVFKSGNNL